MDIVKSYEGHLGGHMKWVSEKDLGLYDAMNKGFKMATGEIIGIINSDDLIADPFVVEKVVRCFETDNSIDAVYADLYYVAQMIHLKLFGIGNRVHNVLLTKVGIQLIQRFM